MNHGAEGMRIAERMQVEDGSSFATGVVNGVVISLAFYVVAVGVWFLL